MCPYAAAHSQLAFFMNNTPVLAVIIVINDDFNNWQQQLGRIHLTHKPAAKWKHATSQRNTSTEVLTEEEATATTPSMLERVQAERVGGNVSEKKRVFLSLFSVFHTDLSGTRSALCGAKCLSEGIRHHSVRSYKLSPRYCVCALPFSLSFSVSLIFWLFSHLEKQWQQTRWSPVQNNYCVLSWFSHTVVKTAQQPAFSQETSVAALNLFGFGDSSSYGNNFITKSLSMQPSQDDCTSRLVRGKSVSKQSRPDSDCLQIHRLQPD